MIKHNMDEAGLGKDLRNKLFPQGTPEEDKLNSNLPISLELKEKLIAIDKLNQKLALYREDEPIYRRAKHEMGGVSYRILTKPGEPFTTEDGHVWKHPDMFCMALSFKTPEIQEKFHDRVTQLKTIVRDDNLAKKAGLTFLVKEVARLKAPFTPPSSVPSK
jgi:hypothetical protein